MGDFRCPPCGSSTKPSIAKRQNIRINGWMAMVRKTNLLPVAHLNLLAEGIPSDSGEEIVL